MTEFVFVVLAGIVLAAAGVAVLADVAMLRRRALLLQVLALAALVLLVGADLPAWAVLVGGLTGGGVVLAAHTRDADAAARTSADQRVVPAVLAALVFAGLYFVVATGHWSGAQPEVPVALTALIGARLLTRDLVVLVLLIVFLAGAVAGAARLAGRPPRGGA